MNKVIFSLIIITSVLMTLNSCKKESIKDNIPSSTTEDSIKKTRASVVYTMPHENQTHEGTWLQWPHQYQYGTTYRNRLDATWVKMTKELVTSEKVHIIAYNTTEKNRIIGLLNTANVPLTNVDFKIFQTNDVWVRDNGPIYVKDNSNNLKIEDWKFNGWGYKASYSKCNSIPNSIGLETSKPIINLNSSLCLEGGAFEMDGQGTLLATKSSIINSNRNPGKTQAQVESILTTNVGATKFIWLNGVAGLEITDMHIDGFAKFVNNTTLVTMNNSDLLYWDVPQTDINTLYAAKNSNNTTYSKVYLPLTQNNVVTTFGKNLGYKGSYCNYYVANTKILVPNYNDPKDVVANAIIQGLYPTRTVVGVDCRNLYEQGGMIHCVTQQQPQ